MAKEVRVFTLGCLLVHAVLSLRWTVLVGIVYWVGHSPLVAVQLGGWLCGWSLMVITADGAVAATLLGLTSSGAAAVAAGAPIVALATLLSFGAPIVGAYLALVPCSLALILALILGLAFPKRHQCKAVYFTWGVLESFMGVVIGHGLQWGMSQMMADEFGDIEEAWAPVHAWMIAKVVLSWLSVLLQLAASAMLWVQSRRELAVCSDDSCRSDLSSLSLFSLSSGAGVRRSQPGCLTLASALLAALAAALLAGAGSYVALHFVSMGEAYVQGAAAPPCRSCYCERRFEGLEVQRDVQYGEAQELGSGARVPLLLDVYRGAGGRRPPAPAVLLIHGGGFHKGSRHHTRLLEEGYDLARRGFVVFNLDYRLMGEVGLPSAAAVRAAVEDLRAAVRFVAARSMEYGVDSSRLAVWGSSAGAITAASLSFADDRASSGSEGFPSNISAAVGLSGSVWPFLVLDARLRGPLPTPAPWFDVHGTSDPMVNFFLAKMTHTYFGFLGLPQESNRMVVIPGAGHLPWRNDRTKSCEGANPCVTLRAHVRAFLAGALRLEGLACAE